MFICPKMKIRLFSSFFVFFRLFSSFFVLFRLFSSFFVRRFRTKKDAVWSGGGPPLVWMFNLSRVLNKRINRIHERGLRIVYEDYTTSYEDLLKRNGSVCIHHRNIQLVAVEMFKVKHDLCPELMKCLFYLVKIQIQRQDSRHFAYPGWNLYIWGNYLLAILAILVRSYGKICSLRNIKILKPYINLKKTSKNGSQTANVGYVRYG